MHGTFLPETMLHNSQKQSETVVVEYETREDLIDSPNIIATMLVQNPELLTFWHKVLELQNNVSDARFKMVAKAFNELIKMLASVVIDPGLGIRGGVGKDMEFNGLYVQNKLRMINRLKEYFRSDWLAEKKINLYNPFPFIYIFDLKEFNNINIAMGREGADQILKQIYTQLNNKLPRLLEEVNKVFANEGRGPLEGKFELYRVGGDEIAVVFIPAEKTLTQRIIGSIKNFLTRQTFEKRMINENQDFRKIGAVVKNLFNSINVNAQFGESRLSKPVEFRYSPVIPSPERDGRLLFMEALLNNNQILPPEVISDLLATRYEIYGNTLPDVLETNIYNAFITETDNLRNIANLSREELDTKLAEVAEKFPFLAPKIRFARRIDETLFNVKLRTPSKKKNIETRSGFGFGKTTFLFLKKLLHNPRVDDYVLNRFIFNDLVESGYFSTIFAVEVKPKVQNDYNGYEAGNDLITAAYKTMAEVIKSASKTYKETFPDLENYFHLGLDGPKVFIGIRAASKNLAPEKQEIIQNIATKLCTLNRCTVGHEHHVFTLGVGKVGVEVGYKESRRQRVQQHAQTKFSKAIELADSVWFKNKVREIVLLPPDLYNRYLSEILKYEEPEVDANNSEFSAMIIEDWRMFHNKDRGPLYAKEMVRAAKSLNSDNRNHMRISHVEECFQKLAEGVLDSAPKSPATIS